MEIRLLIIDDVIEIVEVVSLLLVDKFEMIDSASTVDQALKLIEDNIYTLILLDINLGNRNGAEVIKSLIESSKNPNKNVPFIIFSGIITDEFKERNKDRFAGIISKPFEHNTMISMVENILKKIEDNEINPKEEIPLQEIPFLKCTLPFPIEELDKRVNKVLDQVRKSPKLNQLFAQMKIDRNKDNYILTHISMLINISTAISMKMGWNTDKTLEKFVYAAYLHDMGLSARPDLARIDTYGKLELLKEKLSPAEYLMVFEHPNIGANSVEDMHEIPADVSLIIRQHHELPNETGFPKKCGHLKITPLSVVFIVAHDLTDFIIENPKWVMENYIKKIRPKFKGPHFLRVIKILEEIK